MSTDLDADSPTLALHFWRAGDAERTWKYAQRAGELARHAYANVDAAELYERALDVSRRVPGVSDGERAELWTILGDLRALSGVLTGAIEAYRRAELLTEDPVAKADRFARRADVLERAGLAATALRVVASARRMLASVPGNAAESATLRLDALVAVIRIRQGRLRECLDVAERTVAAARRAGEGMTLATTLLILGEAESGLGRGNPRDRFREALDIFADLGDRPRESAARANLGVIAFYEGRWDEAVTWYGSSRRVALEAGNDFGAAETDLNMAEILVYQGKLEEAEQSLKSSARVLIASGVEFWAACSLMQQARLDIALKDLVAADEHATHAADRFVGIGDVVAALEASLVIAEAALADGRALDALDTINRAQGAAGEDAQSLQARIHLLQARGLAAIGRFEEALATVEAGLQFAQAQMQSYELALLLRERGRIHMAGGGAQAQATAHEDLAHANRLLRELGALVA